MEEPRKLATIPEAILKRRKARDDRQARDAAAQARHRKKQQNKRRAPFKRAEAYIRKHRKQDRSLVKMEREGAKLKVAEISDEPQLAVVMRIKAMDKVHPRVKKILQLFRLRQINTAVFVRLNKATRVMLRLVEPYVAYGYPTEKTVRDLIFKRGHGKVDKRRVSITDNKVIEDALGTKDIICLEDIVHEIYALGPHFKDAANFLWPFKLNDPAGGWSKKSVHFVEGGAFGNREEHVNALLKLMI